LFERRVKAANHRITGLPRDISKRAVREAERNIAARRRFADLGVWRTPAS
jgi:hypothetical protein